MFKNHKIFILIAIFAVLIGGAFYFLNKPNLSEINEPIISEPEVAINDPVLPNQPINKQIINEESQLDVMNKLIEEGIALKSKGDFAGTAELWKQASLANPGSYLPHNNLGFLYRYDIKDPVKAEKSFFDAIAIKSDLTIAYRELSDLYRYAYPEKVDQADDILLQGLEKNPGHYDILIYLAMYYRDMGDREKAKKYFEEALKIKPNNKNIMREINKL